MIDKVVNDLRLYGHITENTQDFRAIDINDAIMQAIRISSYKDKDRVDYTINLVPNIRIFGSKTKLIQIFLNLFKNS